MHELSIALSLLDVAGEAAERERFALVTAIHVRVGPLSGVVTEALLSAYDLARAGSPFEKVALVIEEMPIAIYCPACSAERPAVSVQDLCCAACGGPPSEIVRGQELEVTALEVEA